MKMKVYVDIVFIVNYIYDFIVLLSTSCILKRNVRFYRIILGSLFGTSTIILLFFSFSTISLLIFKIVVSIFIVLISFGFKDIRYFFKNLYYFYLVSIILGGFVYFVNNQFSYNEGLIFFNSYKYNLLLGIIMSILLIRSYVKNIKNLKDNYNKYISAIIYFNDYCLEVNAFVDTGNKLKDPYSFKPIILVDKKIIKSEERYLYVPFKTCNNEGLLKCIKAKKIYIDGIGYKKNLLVGLTDSINIDGVDCLLNERLLEG